MRKFDLEVLVDQFTWIPWVSETVVPEMRWLKFITVFSEPMDLGGLVIKPTRTHGPIKQNYMIIENELFSEDYLSATQMVFQKTQQLLDLLSIVSSRGFKISRIRPGAKIRRKLGLIHRKSLRERMLLYLLKRFSPEPILEGTTDSEGKLSTELTAYRELVAVSKVEGFLEEDVILTTDFPGNKADIEIGMLPIEEFKKRLEEAQRNFRRISANKKLRSSARLYRMSLLLDDYIARYVLMWTALESATSVPRRLEGPKKIELISSRLTEVPGVEDAPENLRQIIKRLNWTRNRIVHEPAFAIRKQFQENLTRSLIELDWILYNCLLCGFGLPLLPEISSPLKGQSTRLTR